MASGLKPRRVGIVGFGQLGEYLSKKILENDELELAFVWNRSLETLSGKIDKKYILDDLSNFPSRNADIIVEVAHPNITENFGEYFLHHADYMCGSPTALADGETERKLRAAACDHGLYIPAGAFWGAEDIKKMADRNTLQGLKVTMVKFPTSFKLAGELSTKYDQHALANMKEKTVLYDGSVRGLCPLAPNNVNTMAAAAVAGHNLGFDRVQGCLVADPHLTDSHTVEVEVWGPAGQSANGGFHVKTVRTNPAEIGKVTGSATYASFYSSVLAAKLKGPGVHLC